MAMAAQPSEPMAAEASDAAEFLDSSDDEEPESPSETLGSPVAAGRRLEEVCLHWPERVDPFFAGKERKKCRRR